MGRADRSSTQGDPRDNRRGDRLRRRFATGGIVARGGPLNLNVSNHAFRTFAGPDPEPDPVVTVPSSTPVLAHRCAGLHIRNHRLVLRAVSQKCDVPYVGDAVCRRPASMAMSAALAAGAIGGLTRAMHASAATVTAAVSTTVSAFDPDDRGRRPHDAPGLECVCGFYAVPVDCPLPTLYEDAPVELFVELSGRVIESDRTDSMIGVVYRAGRQRVLEMRLRPCPFCGRRSTGVYADVHDRRVISTTCDNHGPLGGGVLITLDDLRRMCPVPIVAKPADGSRSTW